MDTNANIIAELQAVFTFAIAMFVAWIAFQQYQVAKRKLRHELFDRRYEVYESVRKFLSSVATHARVDGDEMVKFLEGTATAKFLFDSEVSEYIEEIYRNSLKHSMYDKLLKNEFERDKRLSLIEKESEKLEWLTTQFTVMNEVFGEYLKVDKP